MIKHILAAAAILIILQLAYGQPHYGPVEMNLMDHCQRCLLTR